MSAKSKDETKSRNRQRAVLASIAAIALLVGAATVLYTDEPNLLAEKIAYSEFKERVAAGKVTEVTVSEEKITGKTADEEAFRVVRVEDEGLLDDLEAGSVTVYGDTSSDWATIALLWFAPILILFLIVGAILRRTRAAASQAIGFGRSPAKLVPDRSTGVTFDDVAGCDEAKEELREVVEFLREPARYEALGARIPKGVLLVGPPGTGKTLLARAVAGEAAVPFFSLSASDFIEMFVGVGAARVRDLFERAQKDAPSIVFIDELDAIGRQRGARVNVANDEREQTLNQLLVELDGFAPNAHVIVLSATNRPDILDAALLRPGRFDRQVVLDAPDRCGREAILNVHAKGKPLADDVDLSQIAAETPGFSGADLANTLNEAALLAARNECSKIAQRHLEAAVEKVLAGPERPSRRLNAEERRRVATHEVGHALVAHYLEHSDPVHKITIVPRGRAALGYTLQIPREDQALLTRSQLLDKIAGSLGGRAAEELLLGDSSTGAENDLQHASAVARRMVLAFGMSKRHGLAHHADSPDPFFAAAPPVSPASEATARVVDEEVRRLLDESYERAQAILVEHRDKFDRVIKALLKEETLNRPDFVALLEGGAAAVRGVA